jgi:retrograde regulation protein 2
VLSKALPHGIQKAHFCQGGIREGILFRELDPTVREEDPLEVATKKYGYKSAHISTSYVLLQFLTC